MSREVRYDGAGMFEIRFPFDRELVDLIKTLPSRRWNAAQRFWAVPEQHAVQLVGLLQPRNFRFDPKTREIYRGVGGELELGEATPEPLAPRLPGLFDDPAPVAREAPGEAEDFSVSRLNHSVKQVIERAFPRAVWLVGEISGFNRNVHKRHVSFQLVEKEPDGKTVSSVDATLFAEARHSVERALKEAGEPFVLEDEITVRMRVRVELYVPWGSYRVLVDELDVHYTLGEAARRREEIIRRLTEEGLSDLNPAIPMAAVPLRVGLVTSLGSDAYRDVLRTFEESGFAFRILAHGAGVQGHATEPSVLNALDTLRRSADLLDVVVICRGGGSRTDLAWFDSEALGRAVAAFPLPVLIGIGHEQDHSVLDAVARRAKTPTAAARLLVDRVRESLEAIETLGTRVTGLAGRQVREERQRGVDRGRRLALGARSLLARERVQLGHRASRAGRGALTLVAAARERLVRFTRDIPRAGSVHLARQQTALAGACRALAQGARRDIAAALQRTDTLARALGPRAERVVSGAAERTSARERRLNLVHPRRVLERGYAILRQAGGGVLTSADGAPAGSVVDATLRCGSLRLRSEGRIENQGGEG